MMAGHGRAETMPDVGQKIRLPDELRPLVGPDPAHDAGTGTRPAPEFLATSAAKSGVSSAISVSMTGSFAMVSAIHGLSDQDE